MPESACGPRIDELGRKLRGLEARRAELAAEEPEGREPLSDEDLALLVAHVREIRIVSGSEIYPSFLLPAVRPPQGSCPELDSNQRPILGG